MFIFMSASLDKSEFGKRFYIVGVAVNGQGTETAIRKATRKSAIADGYEPARAVMGGGARIYYIFDEIREAGNFKDKVLEKELSFDVRGVRISTPEPRVLPLDGFEVDALREFRIRAEVGDEFF